MEVIQIHRHESPSDSTLVPVIKARGTARDGIFNPREISIQRSVTWRETKPLAADLPQRQFSGGDNRKLTLSLWVDTYEAGEDVRDYTGKLAALAEVPEGQPRPPYCVVSWGHSRHDHEGLPFTGVVESVTQKFTLFTADGTPVRATVDLQIKGVDSPKNQNVRRPRKRGSPMQARTRLVREGDSLWAIAAQEYGDPARWRPIAAANGILNPRRPVPGTWLTLPAQE
ncbi:CIS tube protein [Streptomyces sp. UC4497]